MDLLQFILTIVLVTASGALAPGPLFFATLSYGARSGVRSGLIFSVAHTFVEFTLIMLLALGLLTVASEPLVKLIIGVAGGVALIIFGVTQIRNATRIQVNEHMQYIASHKHLFIVGVVFTGLNPYFILWWLTVGAQLIIVALEFAALLGVLFMYLCHVWMDYVWLTIVAYFAKKGSNVLGSKGYRILIGIFGVILIYFGLTFLTSAIQA